MKRIATRARLRGAIVAAVATMFLVAGPIAHAQSLASTAEPEGLGKALSYGGCAMGLVVAVTPTQFWISMFNCARILIGELDW